MRGGAGCYRPQTVKAKLWWHSMLGKECTPHFNVHKHTVLENNCMQRITWRQRNRRQRNYIKDRWNNPLLLDQEAKVVWQGAGSWNSQLLSVRRVAVGAAAPPALPNNWNHSVQMVTWFPHLNHEHNSHELEQRQWKEAIQFCCLPLGQMVSHGWMGGGQEMNTSRK